jgi:hypothetical protein
MLLNFELGFMILGLGFRVSSSWVKRDALEVRVGSRGRLLNFELGFMILGLGFRVSSSWVKRDALEARVGWSGNPKFRVRVYDFRVGV